MLAPQFVVVPTKLLARDLISTIEDMHAHNKYSQMLLYIEACESGSMFSGLLKPTLGVLAVTAASPSEVLPMNTLLPIYTCVRPVYARVRVCACESPMYTCVRSMESIFIRSLCIHV